MSQATLEKLRSLSSIDEEPTRGGDLLRLLKPMSIAQSKRAAMTSDAYTVRSDQKLVSEVGGPLRTLPRGIQMAIDEAECDFMMGLFPEITRAWIIVDNIVFLWNYDQPGNAYESYTSANGQLIVSVGLSKPKAGFQAISSNPPGSPDYLLVVSTFLDVTILRLDKRNAAQLSISETNISAPTEGILMRHINGTADGRIFMAGEDGSVHELFYETKRNLLHTLGVKRQCFTLDRSKNSVTNALVWLVPPAIQKLYSSFIPSDPLVRVEIDDGRKLLYALSKKGTISLFNFHRPDEITFVCSFETSNLEKSLDLRSVSLVGVKDVDLKTFDVCSIDVVTLPTSFVHLIIVGRSGVRILFTTCESVFAAASTSSQAHSRVPGKRLNPISIRGPPERKKFFDARSTKQQPGDSGIVVPAQLAQNQLPVLKAYSTGDVTFLAQNKPGVESVSDITCLSLDLSSVDSAKWTIEFFREQADALLGDDAGELGKVFTIREIPGASNKFKQHFTNATERPEDALQLSELVMQYGPVDRRKFLVLSSTGVRMLEKLRPIDVLASLLERPKDVAEKAVPAFFRRFGLDESCAMALAIASRSAFTPETNVFVQNWAQAEVSAKASYFLSSLGYAIPSSSPAEKEFKLPGLKSDREQEKNARGGSTQYGSASTIVRAGPSSSSAVSAQRAVLATVSGTSARDISNKTLEEVESEVIFSGCFSGLLLYASRLLRPLLQWSILYKGEFRWTSGELEVMRTPLALLLDFMERHHPFAQAVKNKQKMQKLASGKHVKFTPEIVEEIRIGEFHSLLKRVVDAMNFFIEIQKNDRKFSTYFKWVFAGNPSELQAVEVLTWEQFISTDAGPRFSRVLVRALLEKDPNLKEGAFVQRLAQTCGDFVSAHYWTHVGAVEEFQKAEASVLNAEWRTQHITKALSLVGSTFTASFSSEQAREEALERLGESCDRCVALNEHWRAVELCGQLAKAYCDCLELDLSKPPVGQTVLSPDFADQGARFRKECYSRAYDVLMSANTSSTSREMFKRGLEIVFRSSGDAMFQFYVFARLLESKLESILIETASSASYVEAFMKDASNNSYMKGKHRNSHLILYARWLAAHDRMGEASTILGRLAEQDDANDDLGNPTLEEREEYLNDAIVYGNNTSSDRADALRELSQLFKAARNIRETLIARQLATDKDEVVQELGQRLVRETRLCDIAMEYKLWDEFLSIVQVFGTDEDVAGTVNGVYGEMLGELVEAWDVPGMTETVRRLAARFGRDERVFPVVDLVENLEGAAAERKRLQERRRRRQDFADTWLLDALTMSGGVPFASLFVAYTRFLFGLEAPTQGVATSSMRLVLEVLNRWKQSSQQVDLVRYLRSPIPAAVDLGCILAILANCQALFAELPSMVEEISSVARELEKL